jgi:putative ABC transport system ATP-binding protein
MTNGTTVVEAVDVRRTFVDAQREIPALQGVALHVNRGEFVAIVGSSGSGKSTLLHLLGGLDRPTQGRITVDGTDVTGLSERELTTFRSGKIGFVFQYFNLIASLSVYENVALPFIVSERTSKEQQDRVADMLELFGLRGREDRSPTSLSAGEQQRVAIARAFLTEPAIVIADEPTGNLDPVTGTETLQLLWESCDNFGQTVVLATHDPQVAAFADRVLFIRDGRVADELTLGRREDHGDAGPVLDRLRRVSF